MELFNGILEQILPWHGSRVTPDRFFRPYPKNPQAIQEMVWLQREILF
jgi:hypothetical protein